MSSTPEQSKRWRERNPDKVKAYRSSERYKARQNIRRREMTYYSKLLDRLIALQKRVSDLELKISIDSVGK